MLGSAIDNFLYGTMAATLFLGVYSVYCGWRSRSGADAGLVTLPLSLLALIASVTPYIGLVGTVWHIMLALGGIGSGNLNVAAIAQPIGAALHATLLGLACAIPAIVFHRITLMLVPDDATQEAA